MGDAQRYTSFRVPDPTEGDHAVPRDYLNSGAARASFSSISIPNAVETTLTPIGITADANVNVVGNTFYILKSGYWMFGAVGNFNAEGGTRAMLTIQVTQTGTRYWRQPLGQGETYCSSSGVEYIYSSADPYIRVRAYQSSGAGRTFSGSVHMKWMGHDY